MISITGLNKKYGASIVLEELFLEIAPRAVIAIMGPSGSGKTTFLRLIAGLESPDKGEIYINGRLASSPGYIMPPHLRGIGMVFQSAALWPHMTVEENVMFGISRRHGRARRQRMQELLESMEIGELRGRYPGQISGGQARRVALARALAARPGLLLLDEPLTNLEERIQKEILEYIRQEVEENASTMVYITHDRDEAKTIADEAYCLVEGKLEAVPNE